ncbi:MAG: hypothetical protein LBJ00_14010 [Planctomycetaceae bacterium]|nr:hypothetical protein [Planctomycetaceae bacterium]
MEYQIKIPKKTRNVQPTPAPNRNAIKVNRLAKIIQLVTHTRIVSTAKATKGIYTQATLKFMELNTQAQHREAVVQGRSLPPIPASV